MLSVAVSLDDVTCVATISAPLSLAFSSSLELFGKLDRLFRFLLSHLSSTAEESGVRDISWMFLQVIVDDKRASENASLPDDPESNVATRMRRMFHQQRGEKSSAIINLKDAGNNDRRLGLPSALGFSTASVCPICCDVDFRNYCVFWSGVEASVMMLKA